MLLQMSLWLAFLMSLSLVFLNSVLLIGFYSLLVSLLVCYVMSMVFSSWFSVIAVVVYVGGLLVMFSYFLALCPNQSVGLGVVAPLMVISVFSLFFMSMGLVGPQVSGLISGSIFFLYKLENGVFLIFLAVFLLLVLISVVKIIHLSQGPLRPFMK